MKILIVSGFLGAGKTTFIKELIKRSGTFPVVLENEYGNNTIDAEELRSSNSDKKKLEILEFMEGCVCCTMKDSFVNSVFTVFSSMSPEYLVVEPTGVGRLSSIIDNLQPILHGGITLLKPVVILSPRSYHQNISEYGALYKDQLANARIVVLSKCENDTPELISEIRREIQSINPDADVLDEHYSNKDDEWWRSIMEITTKVVGTAEPEDESSSISQVTLNNARLDNPGQLIMLLEDCMRGVLGRIVRAKGTIPVGDEVLRFDMADGLYSISGSSQDTNQCVFIGSSPNKSALCRRLGTPEEDELNAFSKPLEELNKPKSDQPRLRSRYSEL